MAFTYVSSIKGDAIQRLANILHLHALPLHSDIILFSALFYYVVYTFVGPWLLRNKAPFEYSKMPKHRRLLWDAFTISISQSLINTTLAFYVIFYQKQFPQSPQERMLGYSSQIQSILAVGAGYFCFHLYQTIKDRHISGYIMVIHGVVSIVIMSLGFHPFAIFYTRWFLIWELPNVFLNFQRWLDAIGWKDSRLRALNRFALLNAYFFGRTVTGIWGTYLMATDMYTVLRDPHPLVREAFLVPMHNVTATSTSRGVLYEAPKINSWLAITQLLSIIVLNLQGIYWFSVILIRKGDNNANYTKSTRLEEIKDA